MDNNIDNSFSKLTEKCKKYVKCDTGRISKPLKDGKMFFIIGFNKNTKENEVYWVKDGERMDFNYVEEMVIASGNDDIELINSIKEYVRLCGITFEEYLNESL